MCIIYFSTFYRSIFWSLVKPEVFIKNNSKIMQSMRFDAMYVERDVCVPVNALRNALLAKKQGFLPKKWLTLDENFLNDAMTVLRGRSFYRMRTFRSMAISD